MAQRELPAVDAVPIPDFCRARALLNLAMLMQLFAIVMSLAASPADALVLERLLLTSLYLHWHGLAGAAVLCLARRRISRLVRPQVTFAACWLLLLITALLVSDIAYELARALLHESLAPAEPRRVFVLRHLLIAAIVSLLLLRWFWLQHQWRIHLRAESEARIQALQARIRPHFLFNALNSLAELIATRPAVAEEMVEDLAELFRVSLGAGSRLVPLSEEIDLVRRYMRIEQTRLGPRLGLEFDIPAELMALEIPQLTIQPLVENAVYHGAARRPGTATIQVRARADGGDIVIEVVNPLPPEGPEHRGTQQAVANIAERLRLLYGDRARLQLFAGEGVFTARLRLPGVRPPAGGAR